MKNIVKVALLAAAVTVATSTQAQVIKKTGRAIDTAAKDVGHGVSKGAKAVAKGTKKGAHEVGKAGKATGLKTAELASKGASAVTDQKYAAKVGPAGQTIYIDKNSAYYYVNSKGQHIYVKKADLKDKP